MNFWKIFQLILQIAPMIIGLVRQIETVMPGPKLGAEKLDLVLDVVKIAASVEPQLTAVVETVLVSATTSIVNKTVTKLNETGAFVNAGEPK